ncbi:MAG TPA: AAA family ATPase [Nannocystaceae bacterium]|nr:AAA family ATPase [Nannocystaceae bacterium]
MDDLVAKVAAQAPVDKWIVDGLIPAVGVTLVVGAAMAGKTQFLGALSAAVASGTNFCGISTKPGVVAWLAEDRDRRGVAENLRRACDARAAPPGGVLVLDPPGIELDDMAAVDELVQRLDANEVAVLVIDCLRRVSRFQENDSGSVSEVHRQLQRLAADRRAVVVIHHVGAKGQIRGSTDLVAGAESVLYLKKAGADGIAIKAEHHSAAPRELSFKKIISDNELHFEAKGVRTARGDGGDGQAALRTELLDAIRDAGNQGINKSELRRVVGGSTTRKDNMLRALLEEGVVTEERRGNACLLFAAASGGDVATDHVANPPVAKSDCVSLNTPRVPAEAPDPSALPSRGGERAAGDGVEPAPAAGESGQGRGPVGFADGYDDEAVLNMILAGEVPSWTASIAAHGDLLRDRMLAFDLETLYANAREQVGDHVAATKLAWQGLAELALAGRDSVRPDVVASALRRLRERAAQSTSRRAGSR